MTCEVTCEDPEFPFRANRYRKHTSWKEHLPQQPGTDVSLGTYPTSISHVSDVESTNSSAFLTPSSVYLFLFLLSDYPSAFLLWNQEYGLTTQPDLLFPLPFASYHGSSVRDSTMQMTVISHLGYSILLLPIKVLSN